MGERTGLGAIERAVLEGLHDLGARPDRPRRKSATVVRHVETERAIGPRYSYDTICYLAAPWQVHLRLVDFHGNLGGPDSRDRPANPRYTEVRLSPAGALAVAAERGDLPRLPIGLINGNLHVDGSRPPFDATRVAHAVVLAGAEPAIGDDELIDIVGPPSFPTGCTVECDLATLAAGESTRLRLGAHVTIEPTGRTSQLVISNLPVGVGPDDVGRAIASRVEHRIGRVRPAHPDLHARLEIPITDIRHESALGDVRVVCPIIEGADPESCRDRVLETWPVTIDVSVQLPRPLAALLRSWVDEPAAQRSALDTLIRDA